jgi:hypothetical protein
MELDGASARRRRYFNGKINKRRHPKKMSRMKIALDEPLKTKGQEKCSG